MDEKQILCVSNAYLHKYYLGSSFAKLPAAVKEELQIACVLFTEKVGGILTLSFDDDKNLYIHTASNDSDYSYDEIHSGMLLSQFQKEKEELLAGIERFYNEFVKGEV